MCLAFPSAPVELHNTGTVEVSLRAAHSAVPTSADHSPRSLYHTAAGKLWRLSVSVNYTEKSTARVL